MVITKNYGGRLAALYVQIVLYYYILIFVLKNAFLILNADQDDINFETDSAALSSILNNRGVEPMSAGKSFRPVSLYFISKLATISI